MFHPVQFPVKVRDIIKPVLVPYKRLKQFLMNDTDLLLTGVILITSFSLSLSTQTNINFYFTLYLGLLTVSTPLCFVFVNLCALNVSLLNEVHTTSKRLVKITRVINKFISNLEILVINPFSNIVCVL